MDCCGLYMSDSCLECTHITHKCSVLSSKEIVCILMALRLLTELLVTFLTVPASFHEV
jgi:hypothetical protein